MGIHPKYREILKQEYFPEAFSEGTPPIGGPKGATVIIEDLMTRIFRLQNQNTPFSSSIFTPDELIEAIVAPIRAIFSQSKAVKQYVLIVDKPQFVPTEKQEEQNRRDSGSHVARYPEGTYTFTRQGLYHQEDDEMYYHIDITRLMRTRHLRSTLWQFLFYEMTRLCKEGDMFCCPQTQSIWFDADIIPYRICATGAYPEEKLKNECGEGDLAMVHWSKAFFAQNESIVFKSKDSDMLPILVNSYVHRYMYSFRDEYDRFSFHDVDGDRVTYYDDDDAMDMIEDGQRVAPQWYWKSNGYNYVHISLFSVILENRYQMAPFTFCLLSILCGTDYFEKKMLTHRTGHQHIIRTWFDHCKTLQTRLTYRRNVESRLRWIVMFIEWYRILLQTTKQKYRPDDTTFTSAMSRIYWHLKYWGNWWELIGEDKELFLTQGDKEKVEHVLNQQSRIQL